MSVVVQSEAWAIRLPTASLVTLGLTQDQINCCPLPRDHDIVFESSQLLNSLQEFTEKTAEWMCLVVFSINARNHEHGHTVETMNQRMKVSVQFNSILGQLVIVSKVLRNVQGWGGLCALHRLWSNCTLP